jgi:hypothetical protein
MQSVSANAIPASNTESTLTTDKAAIIAPAPHCTAGTPQCAAATPHWTKSLFPILLLLSFAALGFFLSWLLDSSAVLLGQKPDRTTQVLMVLMCIGPAVALVIFQALKPDGTRR